MKRHKSHTAPLAMRAAMRATRDKLLPVAGLLRTMHAIVHALVECSPELLLPAQAYADENSLFFWETSAKTNVNVAEVFNDIAERLPRAAAAAAPQQSTGGITLTEPAPEQKKKSSCCSTA